MCHLVQLCCKTKPAPTSAADIVQVVKPGVLAVHRRAACAVQQHASNDAIGQAQRALPGSVRSGVVVVEDFKLVGGSSCTVAGQVGQDSCLIGAQAGLAC